MKVKKLRQILRDALDSIEYTNDDSEVQMVSNTYFLRGANYFMGVAGIDGGYFDLKDIQVLDMMEYED